MLSTLPLIQYAPIQNKRIISRVDFNVTVDAQENILDTTKLKENKKTLQFLLEHGAKSIVLISHRSAMKKNGTKEKPSFKPLMPQIEAVLGFKIKLLNVEDLSSAHAKILSSTDGSVFMLDNIRLHPGEENSDLQLAKEIAKFGDMYIYEAFASYRPEATTMLLPRIIPTYIGFAMQQEITMLSSIFKSPKRPLVCVVGGAKTEVKVGIVRRFLEFADTVVLGGSVANTFLHAWGIYLGASQVDMEMVSVARELLWLALHSRVALELPNDFIASRTNLPKSARPIMHTDLTPEFAAYDIGPQTRDRYMNLLHHAGTIVWNGPMGKFEVPEFSGGTSSLLQTILKSGATSIVGGGHTITALSEEERKKIHHISTGGGAMLVFLESGSTPPIDAISRYNKKYLQKKVNYIKENLYG